MQKKYKVYLLLRSISLLFLSVIPALYFYEILPPVFLPVWVFILLTVALILYSKKIKTIPSILILILAFLIFWGFVLFLLRIIQATPIDVLYIRLKIIFPFCLVFAFFVIITTMLNLNIKAYRKYEPLIFGAVYILAFWSQSKYDLNIFEHSITAIIFSVFFILLLLVQIFLYFEFNKKNLIFFILFIPVLTLILLLFLSFYNKQSISNTGGILQKTMFRFDFSDYLKLEDEIKLQDNLVMIVKIPEEQNHHMLRRMYLSGWSKEKGFYEETAPTEKVQATKLPSKIKEIPHKQFPNRMKIEQEYFLINLDPNSFIAIDYPVMVYPYKVWDTVKFNSAYKVDSMALDIYNYDLTTDFPTGDILEGLSKSDLEFYTRIDNETRKWIEPIAKKASNNVSGYYDTVRAMWEFLADGEYRYSLKPGKAPDGNQLKYFLLDAKKGYCSYYAFAYTLMLRSVGIPARVAVGFFAPEDSAIINYYPIRANMAHAWVEVFFPYSGWITFDPTTSQLAENENLEFGGDAGGDEFKKLLNEILENRQFLEYKNEIDELPENETFISNILKTFLKNKSMLIFYVLILIVVIILALFFMYPYLIIKYSKNNRKVVLTICKIAKRKGCTDEKLNFLLRKAKFAPNITKDDITTAKQIMEQKNENT